MGNEIKEILRELRELKTEVRVIRANMPDREMFLTADEEQLLGESYENETKGELVSSGALRKELGI